MRDDSPGRATAECQAGPLQARGPYPSVFVTPRLQQASRPALFIAIGGAAAIAGCSHGAVSRQTHAQPPARILSIGHPIASRPTQIQRGGTLEIKASAVGKPRSPGFRLIVLRAPQANARDLCIA